MTAYVKLIDCPAHPSGRVHWWDPRRHHAVLFCHGSRWAGIWECLATGESDSCEHEERHTETVQIDYWPTPDVDSSYDQEVYVCDLCGVTIDLDEADPQLDAAEEVADRQVMEALGK